MTAVFLRPQPITRANLQLVIEGGWAPRNAVCQGVAAGSVTACN
jgi:D-xylose transport system substrate-binding protein